MCEMCLFVSADTTNEDVAPGPLLMAAISGGTHIGETGDAAGTSATAYSMQLGDRFEGQLSSGSDEDWIAIDLEAGEDCVFTAFGTDYTAGLDDPVLTIYDASGTVLAINDDVTTTNAFSLIEFTASQTGTYYLGVEGSGGDSGTYALEAAGSTYTVDQVVSQITEFGWGVSGTLSHDETTGDTITVYLNALTAQGQQLATWALEAWSTVSGLVFQQVSSAGAADIRFDDNLSGAFAGPSSYYPSNGQINAASVNVSSAWIDLYGATYDSFVMETYLHEIGHALGLMHSGNYNGYALWGADNHFDNDTTLMTVMSYFSPNEAGMGGGGVAITPMIADIAAMWALYGTPGSVEGGNTTWFGEATVGGTLGTIMGYLFDGDAVNSAIYDGGSMIFTVLDTGGIDLFNLAGETVAQNVDLNAGGISDIGGQTANVVVSATSVIENVITGSGADHVLGNEVANEITTGAGNDVVEAGLGDDTVDTGAGHDVIVMDVDSSDVSVVELSGGGLQITSALGVDLYENAESFVFNDETLTQAEVAQLGSGGGAEDIPAGVRFCLDIDVVRDGLSAAKMPEGAALYAGPLEMERETAQQVGPFDADAFDFI